MASSHVTSIIEFIRSTGCTPVLITSKAAYKTKERRLYFCYIVKDDILNLAVVGTSSALKELRYIAPDLINRGLLDIFNTHYIQDAVSYLNTALLTGIPMLVRPVGREKPNPKRISTHDQPNRITQQ